MKIDGTELGLASGQLVIEREGRGPLTLTLTAWPLGTHDAMQRRIPDPAPRAKGPLLDAKRKPVFGPDGRVVVAYNDRDPEFLADVRAASNRRMICLVAESMRDVKFDSKRPPDDAEIPIWVSYADALLEEFRRDGFAEGEVIAILNRAASLSGMTKEKLDSARESFLSEE